MKNRLMYKGFQVNLEGRGGNQSLQKTILVRLLVMKIVFYFIIKNQSSELDGFLKMIRPRPTLPHALACSTIGAESLNFRVRNGNGCDPFAIKTGILIRITVFNSSK